MLYNYDVSSNYYIHQSDWNNTPKKTDISVTNSNYTLSGLSSMYFEKSYDYDCNKSFTFELADNVDLSKVSLKSIFTSNQGAVSIRDRAFSSNVRVVTYSLKANAKICFLLSNVSIDTPIDFNAYIKEV
jgi:hypothetical protein